jgi:hypothetical protein
MNTKERIADMSFLTHENPIVKKVTNVILSQPNLATAVTDK